MEQEEKKAKEEFELLPTGKPHLSFSELSCWANCSYRHKLKHIDHLDQELPGIHADFGTAIHTACEVYLRERRLDVKLFKKTLFDLWKEHEKLSPAFTVDAFKSFVKEGLAILPELPAWLDATFPGWEFIDAEHFLYEPIGSNQPHAFKGYIDGVIKAPGPRNKQLIWLIDFKTCGWGWPMQKKNDELVKMQLTFYKHFWATKTLTEPSDVRCAFVLLKRTAKPGNHIELVKTSVGDVTIHKSLRVINNMIKGVKSSVAIKNRDSCKFCEFFETEHCT